MDQITEKQIQIARHRLELIHHYPTIWDKLTLEWKSPDPEDRAWLMYSANYLFRTAGIRWALDPLTLRQRVPSAPEVDISALAPLDFIVLTHRHADHMDLGFLSKLRDFPTHWIVPEVLLESLQTLNLPPDRLMIAHPLEPLHLGGLTLTPFNGLHWADDPAAQGGKRGVPATGYLAEFNGKRWLLPGDTRTYEAALLPDFGLLDGLIAHLWLGRGCALEPVPPLLVDFCSFCLDFHAKQIIITHLEEFGRNAIDYWDDGHYQLVKNWLGDHGSNIMVKSAFSGESVEL
jgi:hypothetical protein